MSDLIPSWMMLYCYVAMASVNEALGGQREEGQSVEEGWQAGECSEGVEDLSGVDSLLRLTSRR